MNPTCDRCTRESLFELEMADGRLLRHCRDHYRDVGQQTDWRSARYTGPVDVEAAKAAKEKFASRLFADHGLREREKRLEDAVAHRGHAQDRERDTKAELDACAAGPWVAVTERLPESHDGRLHLVWSSATGHAHLAYRCDPGWVEFEDPLSSLRFVTHWASIHPPKVKP